MVVYGIDLGTTYTKVAYVSPHDGSIKSVSIGGPHPIHGLPDPGLRSSVALFTHNGTNFACVGEAARSGAGVPGVKLIEESKALIGLAPDEYGDPALLPPWSVEGQNDFKYRPEDIAALVLRRTKQVVDLLVPGHPMVDVVITCPQRFEDTRREATRRAASIAGLNVREMLTEPDAVSFAFGLTNDTPGIYMIYDIGGGTTDVNIVEFTRSDQGGRMNVLGTAGNHCAGRSFDSAILDTVIVPAYHQATHGLFTADALRANTGEHARFMRLAEELKLKLSSAAGPDVAVQIAVQSPLGNGLPGVLNRSRSQVNHSLGGAVDDCRRVAEEALAAARSRRPALGWSNLEGALIVGGSSGLPWIRDMVESLIGKPPRVAENPSVAIAEGAAYFAERGARATRPANPVRPEKKRAARTRLVDDTTAFTSLLPRGLGVVVWDGTTQREKVSPLLKSNTELPTQMRKRYLTQADGDQEFVFTFMEGDDQTIENCMPLAELVFELPEACPARDPFDVVVSIDHSGRKSITVEHPRTGRRQDVRLQYDEGAVVSESDIDQRRRYIERIQLVDHVPGAPTGRL